MSGPYELGEVPKGLRRRAGAVATVAMVAIAVALLVVVLLVEGVRPEPLTWLIMAAVAVVVVAGVVLAVRSFTAEDRAAIEASRRRILDPPPEDATDGRGWDPRRTLDLDLDLDRDPGPERVADPVPDLDLTEPELVDPLAPVPEDHEVLAADASELELLEGPVTRVVLHPGPVTRRRLAGRPDALVVVADAVALDVPGWIVERRSRMIERTDRVRVPWSAIARFRVRADSDGPDIYDITGHPDAPPPQRWRIRRNEIADEIGLLDHVRRIGRITIELEDSIRS